MEKTFLKIFQVIPICLLFYNSSAFAQTGQKGSDYPVITNKNLAVIVIDFPDTPKSIKDKYFPTIAALRDTIFNGSIKKYLTDISYGQFTLTGDVFGYFTHQTPGYVNGISPGMTDVLTINTINIPEWDINKYDGFIIIPINDVYMGEGMFSNNEFLINGNIVSKDFIYCDLQIGFNDRDSIKNPLLVNHLKEKVPLNIIVGTDEIINDNTNGVNYSAFNRTISHELGHFLGLGRHANSRTNSTSFDYESEVPNNNCKCYSDTTKGSLLSLEYGNMFDIMGSSQYGMSLNMVFRDFLGWTNSNNRYSIKNYGHFTTTLFPLNNLNGIRTIEIRVPYQYCAISIFKNKGYFLEVRSGNNKWERPLLSPGLQGNNDGIMVMRTDGLTSELIDASPSANINYLGQINPDMRDVVLKPGMEYKNKEIKLSNVKKNADGSFSIDIDVYISEPKVNLGDSLALISLYNQCNGKNWTKKTNWLIGSVETWEGIRVENGRVVLVDLEYIGLSGQLPSEFSNLTEIRSLNLSRNQLTEINPASWSNLVNIEQLAFSENQLISFPDLSAMSKLKNLDCRYNLLDFGDIEPYIGFPKYGFWYSPQSQSTIGQSEIIIKKPGEEFKISVTVGGNSNKYQWYKNGVNISGANLSEYVNTSVTSGDAGIYSCQITNTKATELTLTSEPVTLEVNLSTGEDLFIDNEDILIYPNPTKGRIHIKMNDFSQVGTKISIYNISGKLISESIMKTDDLYLNLLGNPPGLYLIKIGQKNQKTFRIVLE